VIVDVATTAGSSQIMRSPFASSSGSKPTLPSGSVAAREPANPAQAEEAFKTSLAIAKQQGARGFELQASLALAKLYQ
jgi:hypothetical protein